MIAHVAQAGEDRGRVVLRIRPSVQASDIALAAAVRVAQAFHSEIESLLVEEQQLFEMASFPFAREISLTGRTSRAISPESLEREVRNALAYVRRKIEVMARNAEVTVRMRSVRGEPIDVLVSACEECGPWNVVALAEPFTAREAHVLQDLFGLVTGTTGVVLVGPKACRMAGPIVAAVEDIDDLPGMLRAAERLAAREHAAIQLLLVAESADRALEMESETRLAISSNSDVRITAAEMARGEPAVIAETLRRMKAGFVIARFGGLVMPRNGDIGALSAALECPLFLVR